MTETTEPQTAPLTEAGRRLLASLHAQAPVHVPIEQDAASILAIEREAATRARSGLDAGLRDELMGLLGRSHPHDEERECGTCAAYNLLASSGEAAPTTPDDYTVARYLREEAGEAAPVDGLRAALDEAATLIETGENRAQAADGPVSHFRDELDDREWRRLWLALSKVRALAREEADDGRA